MDKTPLTSIARRIGEYVLAAILCIVLLAWLYNLPRRDLRDPLDYSGDTFESLLLVRSIADHDSFLVNHDFGAPHGLTFHDYQRSANVQLAFLWTLSRFTQEPFLIQNLYFLLTYLLATLVCLGVLRHFGIPYFPALTSSLLFAFLPYHAQRGVSHLFLSGYYFVPLGGLLALWVYRGEPIFRHPLAQGGWRRGVTGRGVAAIACVLLIGSTEIYYTYFTLVFVGIASVAAAWRDGRWLPARSGVALAGLLVAVTVVNLAPLFAHRLEHGPNTAVMVRGAGDAHYFDLRISQLLMPATGHRVPLLARAKASFNARIPMITENDTAALGVLGSIGFLYLLSRLLPRPHSDDPRQDTLQALATLNIFAVLLATMGGFSVLIASAFPMIRCYTRLSVFIALFALFALAHLLQEALARMDRRPMLRPLAAAFCVALACAGAWDQTPASTASANPKTLESLRSDRDMVQQIEARSPTGGQIFQLPFIPFPEGHYTEHMRLSIHSRSCRWSFPAMRGRYASLWQEDVASQDTPAMIEQLCWAGFSGVCCDQQVEADRIQTMSKELGAPLVSPDGRFAFFDLGEKAARLREAAAESEMHARRQAALFPVLLSWSRGFQQLPKAHPAEGRWGHAISEVTLHNYSTDSIRKTLVLQVHASPAGPGTLHIEGAGADRHEPIDAATREIHVPLLVAPGRTKLNFRCDAPCDPHHARRHFRVVDFAFRAEGN